MQRLMTQGAKKPESNLNMSVIQKDKVELGNKTITILLLHRHIISISRK